MCAGGGWGMLLVILWGFILLLSVIFFLRVDGYFFHLYFNFCSKEFKLEFELLYEFPTLKCNNFQKSMYFVIWLT